MNIPLNKDIEVAYKDEFAKGFTLPEVCCIGVAAAVMLGVGFLVHRITSLAPDICVYVGIGCGLPILYLGFRKFSGMSFAKYLDEIIYEHKTKDLCYEAEENTTELMVFAIKKEGAKK